MAGSGGGPFRNRAPERLTELVRSQESKEFDAELSQFLGDLLAAANSRDVPLVNERLAEIRKHLEDTVDDELNMILAGSVAKHTFVDGLSDIDSLLIIDKTEFEGHSPSTVLDRMTELLKKRLLNVDQVSHGQMAVTVTYPDGMIIQLLPAMRTRGKLRIPSPDHDAWSTIEPAGFREALTTRNAECGGKLVPTIKLAKAVIGTLPKGQQLSGYHMESLAIAAFKDYKGPKTTSAMLPTFFQRAKDLVLQPITDRTGQSIHVDEDLGPAGSESRQKASHILNQIAKRMRNATGASSTAQWREIFKLE